jgi:hypothetical protein
MTKMVWGYFFLQNAAAQQARIKPAMAASGGSADFVTAGATGVNAGTADHSRQDSSHGRKHFCFASHHV